MTTDEARGETTARERAIETTARERALGRLSFAFMLDQAALGVGQLSTIDSILVMAINQANIQPLTREPLARIRHGRMEAPAPDARRRPVSINAVAASLRLPFETVRRRVRRLEALGACVSADGGIIVPETFLVAPDYVQGVAQSHQLLRAFYYDASAQGLVEPLPRSAYPPEPAIPIRAAARLLSDYVLRTTDEILVRVEDLVSAVVLLAILGGETRTTNVARIAKRLRMPMETARRHVLELTEKDCCVRSAKGLFAPPEMLERPEWRVFLRDNAANVQRLFAGLAERGVIEAWSRLAPPLPADDATGLRASPAGA